VLTPIDPMIVKAINQDEFRDFSFVNPDWKPHQYRIGIDSTEPIINNNLNQPGNLNIQTHVTIPSSQNVQLIIMRSNSPQQTIDSTSISSNTTELTMTLSNSSINPLESSSVSHTNDDSNNNNNQLSSSTNLFTSSNSSHSANTLDPLSTSSNSISSVAINSNLTNSKSPSTSTSDS
jgi:hypothetical protein